MFTLDIYCLLGNLHLELVHTQCSMVFPAWMQVPYGQNTPLMDNSVVVPVMPISFCGDSAPCIPVAQSGPVAVPGDEQFPPHERISGSGLGLEQQYDSSHVAREDAADAPTQLAPSVSEMDSG